MRTCIVTGANSGIGLAASRQLAERGWDVILACRDVGKGEAAEASIRDQVPGASLRVVRLDLASFAAIRTFVREIRGPVHALINNAGCYPAERRLTEDGHEEMLQVGFLGPWLLTTSLLGALPRGARVVNLAGIYHRRGVVDLDDLDWERRPWDRAAANAAVQLARVMFTLELAHRCPEITANAVHPGAVLTEALKQAPFAMQVLAHTLARPGFVKPDKGAAPVVRLADDPALEGITGRWFDRYTDAEPAAAALDPDRRARLWAAAEQATSAR